MKIPIETVTADAVVMNYFRFGKGEKILVILPGLSIQSVAGCADAVAKEYAALTDDFTVYVFDRRTNLPAAYSVYEMAEDTARAFSALGLKDVSLFGVSQGGMMGLVIAIRHPELVQKLILGSSSSHLLEDQYRVLEGWARLAKEKDPVGLYLDFGEKIYPPAVFRQCREALIALAGTVTDRDLERFVILAEGTRGFDVSEELGEIRCPVLAIGVFEDAVLDADATMEIAEHLDDRKDFRLYMYTGFGHAAFDTAPDYRERMLRFLKE